jgi:acyl carrier protein
MNQRFVAILTPYLKFLQGRPITEQSRLRDLGLDSMQSIDLLFAVEDAFGVSLPEEYLNDTTFATAGSLWRAIEAVREGTEAA